MSTLGELFAPKFTPRGYRGSPSERMQAKMAEALGLDSLRYLSADDLGSCLDLPDDTLCKGCVTAAYPTEWGNKLVRCARRNARRGQCGRTYE